MLDFTQLWTTVRSLFQDRSYGTTLEQYIVSRNPQNPADIERYTTEFQSRHGGTQWI